MHRALEKLAKQLNAYDEDSLMMLWERYAVLANNFEPTTHWEEGALVFCMLQAVRWKNQLFNYHITNSSDPLKEGPKPVIPTFLPKAPPVEEETKPSKSKATVLQFTPKDKGDE